jgi:hypothetical protein
MRLLHLFLKILNFDSKKLLIDDILRKNIIFTEKVAACSEDFF